MTSRDLAPRTAGTATSRSRRLAAPLAVGAGVLVASAYVGLVDPGEPGHYPLCPIKWLTGLDCPGCGGLRALHALLNGDAVAALDRNAFVVLLALPAAAAVWGLWLRSCWRGSASIGTADRRPARGVPVTLLAWSFLAVMVAFTILRNVGGVPAFAWLGSSAG